MNRLALLCGFLSIATLARADGPPPATQPATAPAAQAAAAPAAAAPESVYVLPFTPLSPAPGFEWVGKGVQQNLVTDLTRAAFRPTAADAQAPADAVAAARSAGAAFVVTGTYQWADPRLRFDGQLLDANTGNAVAGLSVTGDARDLFALEDDLSDQLVRDLRPAPAAGLAAGHPVARPVPPALRPAAVAAAIAPPAGGVGSYYQGSALQAYVDADRTPSVDYTQQVLDARDRSTFGSFNTAATYGNAGYGGFASNSYGGYGSAGCAIGISYPIGSVGGFGYGSFGRGGLGSIGFGGIAGRGIGNRGSLGSSRGTIGFGGRLR